AWGGGVWGGRHLSRPTAAAGRATTPDPATARPTPRRGKGGPHGGGARPTRHGPTTLRRPPADARDPAVRRRRRARRDAGAPARQAPFLIGSQALENRVVTSPLAATMLAGLDKAGVTGLALVPAELLHPFGFGTALRAPRDFAGATLRAPESKATDRLVRALG